MKHISKLDRINTHERWLIVIIFFLLSFLGNVFAQEIGIGQWHYQIAYHEGEAIADAGDRVYYASKLGIIYFDKTDNSIARLTRAEGLSDVGISDLEYSVDHNLVVVGYENGNLDLIRGTQITNLGDIRRANILGSKQINRITIEGDYAYLSCDFGIIVLDLVKSEFKDTYQVSNVGNQIVRDIAVVENSIYAASEVGMFVADRGSNLNDPQQWLRISELPDSTFSHVFVYKGVVYANYSNATFNSDTLYSFADGEWQIRTELLGKANREFDISEEQIVISHTDKVSIYNSEWSTVDILDSYGYIAPSLNDVVFDAKDPSVLWGADQYKGFVKIVDTESHETLTVNAPKSNLAHEITYSNGDIWVATGTVEGFGWSSTYNREGVMRLSENRWSSYNRFTMPEIDSLFDFLSVAVDRSQEDKIFFSAHGDGIVEMIDGEFSKIYGQSNSEINLMEEATPTFQFAGMTALVMDNNNVLWGANSGAANVLCAKDPLDNWYSYSLSSAVSSLGTGRMIATSNNHIWVSFPNNGGIGVYNYNNTIADQTDDQVVALNTSVGDLPSNSVLSMAEDLSGQVWVGTVEGVAVFRSPSSVFEDSFNEAEKILIQQDGYTEYLLESQSVSAIAVDGANRKWMGTTSAGIFLIAADGKEELLHFTKENSPLMSNAIQSIGINGETGEVFFGTEQGICSYRSTATDGKQEFNNIYAYPNPVEPGYNGDIAIAGLVADSEVRITDLSGNVVYSGVAFGGQAIWNGKTPEGNRVKTGVYLVFCAAQNGSDSAVTKILFLN